MIALLFPEEYWSMIDKLISACFNRRHIVWGAAILIGIYGYISGTQMMVEAYPELDDVSVSITTQVPGLAAEEIEQQITIPLERALVSVPDLSVLRSSSTFALPWSLKMARTSIFQGNVSRKP